MIPKYSIGQQFTTRGKHPQVCTIVDIWTTLNSAGKPVKLRYVATHQFMGQTITDYDVLETTIAMGIARTNVDRTVVQTIAGNWIAVERDEQS